jgi:hypothetical protein
MKTRSRLVHVPALPWRAETLMPQHRLAALAGALVDHGHATQILDWGGLSALERLACAAGMAPEVSRGARRGLGLLRSLTGERRQRAMLETGLRARAVEVARAVLSVQRPDFVVFLADRRADLLEARRCGALLREWAPEVVQVVAGAHVEEHTTAVVELAGFDAALTGDTELGMLALAEAIRDRKRWDRLPNVAATDARGYAMNNPEIAHDWSALGTPNYDRAIYPAMAGNEKIKLLSVEHSRGRHHVPHGVPEPALCMRQVRTKPVTALGEEVARLVKRGGFRAFHFLGEATPAAQVDGLGYELMARCLHVYYSRDGHVRHLDPGTVQSLAKSGCTALGFRLDSGSQRLLEDFYGHDFGVSQAESVMRACREEEIFLSTGWTYPCPQDDRHTREETVRLLRRCRPDAAWVHRVRCPTGSAWALRSNDFGCAADPVRVARWAAASSAEPAGTLAPLVMAGWKPSRVAAEREWLFAQMEALGIGAQLSARDGLVARLAGFAGEEAVYHARLRQALATYDLATAHALVASFNEAATVTVNRIRLRPHQPNLAVGN